MLAGQPEKMASEDDNSTRASFYGTKQEKSRNLINSIKESLLENLTEETRSLDEISKYLNVSKAKYEEAVINHSTSSKVVLKRPKRENVKSYNETLLRA